MTSVLFPVLAMLAHTTSTGKADAAELGSPASSPRSLEPAGEDPPPEVGWVAPPAHTAADSAEHVSLVREIAMLTPPPVRSRESIASGGAFICINGQIGRVEVANKCKNLFTPLAAEYGSVHVTVVAAADAAVRFVNGKDQHGASVSPEQARAQLAFKVDRLRQKLEACRGISRVEIVLGPPSTEHPVVNPLVVNETSTDRKRHRPAVEMHARQYHGMFMCGGAYLKAVAAHGAVALAGRIRDDGVSPTPLNAASLRRKIEAGTPTLVGALCGSQNGASYKAHETRVGGLGDKVVFAPPGIAFEYFTNPLLLFYNLVPGNPGGAPHAGPEAHYDRVALAQGWKLDVVRDYVVIASRYVGKNHEGYPQVWHGATLCANPKVFNFMPESEAWTKVWRIKGK